MLVSSANKIGTEVLFVILGRSLIYIIATTEDPGQSLVAYCNEF
jgi:hypothetical protein